SAPKLNGLADLSGQKVFVRPSSSHFESLRKLNMDLRAAGKEPAEIVELDDSLESSDLLEMVNADLIPITIADNHVAEMWSGALPEIQVYSKLQLNAGQNLAWALRKNSPQLKEFLDAFITKNKVGTTFGNIMVKRYFTNNKWITNPNASAERKRFEDTVALFKKYGEKYDFDYLLLAAQGFQESKLDQSLRSRVGAIGVMQLMPKTGESMQV
ncbi:MAG: transporter substrate-binding domain-containing protein, partial [Bdellovibrionales bacterium]|nr:transporter substrate-binding domain-containing protein [Bdellovibrionales bacterium]